MAQTFLSASRRLRRSRRLRTLLERDAHLDFLALDADQLDRSTRLGRVIYTFNYKDFARIHALYMRAGRSHAGIIIVQDQRTPIGDQIRWLSRMQGEVSTEEMIDRLAYLANWS